MVGDFRMIQKPYKGVTIVASNPNAYKMNKGSHYGIHKKGCRDIKRGLKQWTQGFGGAEPNISMLMHYDTLKDALPSCVPDYAYDDNMYDDSITECEEGTLKAGDENAFVYVFPCCKDANCGGD